MAGYVFQEYPKWIGSLLVQDAAEEKTLRVAMAQAAVETGHKTCVPSLGSHPYGILRFGLSSKVVETAKPAAMLSNCPHPARMVLGPGGL
jgi:hypothetical protein